MNRFKFLFNSDSYYYLIQSDYRAISVSDMADIALLFIGGETVGELYFDHGAFTSLRLHAPVIMQVATKRGADESIELVFEPGYYKRNML